MTAIKHNPQSVVMESVSVSADAEEVATFLHALANRIEAGQGDEVLIGLWNTGHGEAWEWTFQVVIDRVGSDRQHRDGCAIAEVGACSCGVKNGSEVRQ